LAIAVVVLAITVAVPEMAAPAGAVAARSANRSELQARPAQRQALVAKRRKRTRARRVVRRAPLSTAQRKARLVIYLKAHPGVVASKLGTSAAKVKHPVVKKRKPTARRKATKVRALAPRRRVRRAGLVAVAKKPKAVKSHALGMSGWAELLLLAVLPFGAVGATLLGTDRARRPREPRAPSPSKRRRTLVITPMRGR